MQECIRIVLNLLENPVIVRKKLQEKLCDITVEHNFSKKLQCYQYLNKDLQYISNKDLTQKFNAVNKVSDTKESSEYYQSIRLKIPDMFQHQTQV